MNFGNMFETKTAAPSITKKTLNGPVYDSIATVQEENKNISTQAIRQLDVLRRMNPNDVASFGSNAGTELAKLSEEVTKKVTLADSGFSDGVVQILKLTSQVDINQLGEKKQTGLVGFVSGIKNKITGHKVEFMANFNSTSTEIKKIGSTLMEGVRRMQNESKWLEQCYQKNLDYLRELEINAEALEFFVKEQQDVLAQMQASNVDPMKINDQQSYITRLERQHDKTIRLIQVARLTAPEIRLMQQTNYNNSEDFKDLIETTIPAWEKKISLAIISIRQKKDTELSNTVKDKSNEFFKTAADLVHDNSIAAAQARNKSSLELETIEHMQKQMIDAVQQVKQIDEQGRQKRADTASRLAQMKDELHNEMRTW